MVKVIKPINETEAILKEVWNTEGIQAKTELDPYQIEAVNKFQTSCYIFGSIFGLQHTRDFLILQKSKERKSMGEFVESLKSKTEQLMSKAKEFRILG